MRGCICAILLCAAAGWCAGPPPPPGAIRSIIIKGNNKYKSADIEKETGLTVGEHVTEATIEQARQRLLSLELFNNVADQYKWTPGAPYQYDITFEVSEIPQLFPIRFDRLKEPGDQLQTCVMKHVPLYSDEIPATEGVLQRYTRAVQECVSAAGDKTTVKAHVSNDDPKEVAVVFAPDTPPPVISQVEISGNKAVDTGTLLRSANLVAIGVPLTDERLKMLLDGSLKQVYAAHGFVAVTFPKVEAVPSKDSQGVVLKVQIQEGPVFDFGAIRFRGSGMDPDEVKANVPFHSGDVYNARKVDDFRIWLAHRLRQGGHLDASVTFDTDTDNSEHKVSVIYSVAPGPVYTFNSLDIQGLDLVSSPVIEKLWGEKQGKPFNPDYPDFFLKRVQEQNLFDHLADTNSDYTADPASHSVIVHLYFKGGKTRQQRAKEEEEERQKRTTDGDWSPF